MSKEAMKLAFEVLQECRRDPRLKYEHPTYDKAIKALEEALAKQEQGEPVAMLKLMMEESAFEGRIELSDALLNIDEFYTTPQQRKPLTDEQIEQMWERTGDYDSFARAIEAAHGIKE